MEFGGLFHNGPYPMGFDDAPHKEGDTRNGHHNGLQREQVSAF